MWEGLGATTSALMPINIVHTPLRRLADRSHFLGAVAFADSSVSGLINIYRLDPKDHLYNVNVDYYFADLAFGNRSDLSKWVAEASTSLNSNLRSFILENIPIFKIKPDPDHHWLLEVPTSVLSVWEKGDWST
jgi:hypothetical protein